MARKPDAETLKLLKNQVQKIKKRYHPEKIILFGSRARGDNLKDSDIDILVVSRQFQNMNWRERIQGVFGTWDKKQMLEPICLTPEELEKRKKQLGIVQQALREGIEIQ
ncbi:nucleotidyltransferase domain-containing protein [Candidatus Woesearchaeota archaeon]|nr:nucleotidyltransferase domain-containing protein [Candidatus Woesearchaeota archaeon]